MTSFPAPPPAPGSHLAAPAFDRFELPVSRGHRLHVERWGAPDGVPVLLLHGGPGSGSSPRLREAFDPARFHVISPDQRGAGRSTPAGETAHNTTAHLLDDLRRLRAHLGIGRWLVAGGSWGAALALAHAADQPQAVAGLLLRAVFLARPQDIEPFFANPLGHAPDAWARFAGAVPTAQRDDLLAAYAAGLADADPARRRALALAWWGWETSLAGQPGAAPPAADALVRRYRIQAHYLRARCWLEAPPLLERCGAIAHLPAWLVHGTHDRVCAPEASQALHRRLPGATLRWAPGAGHDPFHPALAAALASSLDEAFDTVRGHWEARA